jgi:SAM-dependent methyltransferase
MIEPRQSWDAERYHRNASHVFEGAGEIVSWLGARPGMRVLDLGCGHGALTEALAATGAELVGVDASAAMVASARERGLDARLIDARGLAFEDEFDAVFSNAALHWIREADAVIAGVARALVPDGRFVGEFGGEGDVSTVLAAAAGALARRGIELGEGPWYFPAPEEYRRRLEARGFAVERIALVPRRVPLPGHLSAWLETFGESFLSLVPQAEEAAVTADICAAAAPHLRDGDGIWSVDHVRLRFAAGLVPVKEVH